MKTIAIFLLVAFSLFGNGHCDGDIVQPVLQCVVDGVKKTPMVLDRLTDALCMYEKAKSGNDDTVKEAVKSVESIIVNELGCTGVSITGSSLSSVSSDTADVFMDTLKPTLDKIGLFGVLLKFVCKFAKPLTSGCLKQLIEGVLSGKSLQTGMVGSLTGGLLAGV